MQDIKQKRSMSLSVKRLFGYLGALEYVYGCAENSAGFEKLKEEAEFLEIELQEVLEKGKQGKLTQDEAIAFAKKLIGLKHRMDSYEPQAYKGKTKGIIRDIRAELDSDERKKALADLDAKVTRHLEKKGIGKRAEKVFELLAKTWPYMSRTLDPEQIDAESINFAYLADGQETDVPYQREMAYVAVVHSDKERFKEFEKLVKRVNKEVKKRIDRGERKEAAVMSELSEALESAYPEDEYAKMFPYAALCPIEELGTYETDDVAGLVAEKLGVDRKAVDAKALEARPENRSLLEKLINAGRFFTRKIF
jgi:hypothetical protein